MSDDDFRVTRIRPSGQNSWEQQLAKWKRQFMGNGGKGNGSGNNQNGPPSPGLIILVLVAILAGWGAMTSFYTIDVSEEGVVTRLGKYVRTTGSGFHWKVPFGIEEVHKVQSKKILQEEFGFRSEATAGAQSTRYSKDAFRAESVMLTGDLNVADVEWVLQYRIADPWKYMFHARNVQKNIRDVSMSIMRRVVGDRLVGEILTTARVAIADDAKQLTQEVIDKYDMGIKVERIILQDVNPPEKVKPAFNDVNAAKQEQEKTVNNAERDYNKVIPEARGKAKRRIAEAEAYQVQVVNQAKGNAQEFRQVLAAYKKAPDVTKRRIYLDAMQNVLSGVEEVTVVDDNLEGLLPIFQTQGTGAQLSGPQGQSSKAKGASE